MLAAICLMLASAAAVPAATADSVRPAVQIEIDVEPGVAIELSDLQAAAADIRRIWAPVLDLGVTIHAGASGLWGVDAIPLVITNRTLDSRETTGLGWIGFSDGEPQIPMTVSLTAIRRMAQRAMWHGMKLERMPTMASRRFVQRGLARAAAHEIGHYLLRSQAHARSGLMRPVFTAEQIMDAQPALDRLDPANVAKLRSNAALLVKDAGIANRQWPIAN